MVRNLPFLWGYTYVSHQATPEMLQKTFGPLRLTRKRPVAGLQFESRALTNYLRRRSPAPRSSLTPVRLVNGGLKEKLPFGINV